MAFLNGANWNVFNKRIHLAEQLALGQEGREDGELVVGHVQVLELETVAN